MRRDMDYRELLAADLSRDLYIDPEERKRLLTRLQEEGSVRAVELHLKAKNRFDDIWLKALAEAEPFSEITIS